MQGEKSAIPINYHSCRWHYEYVYDFGYVYDYTYDYENHTTGPGSRMTITLAAFPKATSPAEFLAPCNTANGTRTTARGFEPLRAEPNEFRVHLLNHSDTLSC
jgi:hypothetical protein